MSELIDKLAWIHIDKRRVLAAVSRGKQLPYLPGGKREPGEEDQATLIREIREELSVDLLAFTLQFVGEFTAQADGQAEGVMVRLRCFIGEYQGELRPAAEIASLCWLRSGDRERCSPAGRLVLDWLKSRDLID